MQPTRLFASLVWPLLLTTACGHPGQHAYDASADCAANELAWHRYVDQAKEPSHMVFANDRRRFALLWLQVQRDGKRLGLSVDQMHI